MGEALPFWMWRLDFMGAPGARGAAQQNQLKPSEYFRRNIAITTSGVDQAALAAQVVTFIGRMPALGTGRQLSVPELVQRRFPRDPEFYPAR